MVKRPFIDDGKKELPVQEPDDIILKRVKGAALNRSTLELEDVYCLRFIEFSRLKLISQDITKKNKEIKIPIEEQLASNIKSYSCQDSNTTNSLFNCPYGSSHYHVGRTICFLRQETSSCNKEAYFESFVYPKIWIDQNKNYSSELGEGMLQRLHNLLKKFLKYWVTNEKCQPGATHQIITDSMNRQYLLVAINSTELPIVAENLQYLDIEKDVEQIKIVIPSEYEKKEPVLISIPLFGKHVLDEEKLPKNIPKIMQIMHPLISDNYNNICLVKRLVTMFNDDRFAES